jgi:L-lactate dehydrogenase complex protein LldE
MRISSSAVASRCREFSQFVASRAPNGIGGRVQASVAYHPSCHLLRGLGIRAEPAALIGAIDGVTQPPVADQEECCGFGGLFSVKNAEISASMLDRKIASLEAAGVDRVVSCDLGCLLQIGGGLRRRGSRIRAQHLGELLDEATVGDGDHGKGRRSQGGTEVTGRDGGG